MIGPSVRRAIQCWWLALPLYLIGLAIAGLITLPVALGLAALAPLGPWVGDVAAGGLPAVLAEATGALSAGGAVPAAGSQPPPEIAFAGIGAFAGLLLLPVGSALQGAAYTVLSGGLLDRLVRGGSVRAGCRRWLWPMVRCTLIGGLIFAGMALIGLLPLALIPGSDPIALSVKGAVWLIWLSIANGVVELIRAGIVAGEDRRVLIVASRTLRRLSDRGFLLRALIVWPALGLVGLTLGLGHTFLAGAIPATNLPVSVVVAQILLLAGAWLKVLRLAVAAELANPTDGRSGAIAPPAAARYTVQDVAGRGRSDPENREECDDS